MSYDLLVKGGLVVDPSQGINAVGDVAISRGRVAALEREIAAGEATQVIDAEGMVVTPGLIDIHTHVADGIVPLAASPDEAGVLCGVTTVADAGSTGYANFGGFRRYVIPAARTDVFCFLHLCPVGEAVLPEIGWQQVSAEQLTAVVEANRDLVRGVKLRLTVGMIEAAGLDAVKTAKQVAARAALPVLLHLGIDAGEQMAEGSLSAFTQEVLALLEKGDILTHVFTKKAGGVLAPPGHVMPGLREAVGRGVVLDVAAALGHLDFAVARQALNAGLLPTTLSTDSTSLLLNAPVPFSLAVLMSEFMALGLTLSQVVEMATVNPAKALGEEQRRGSLRAGMPADVSLFRLAEGDFFFVEGREGNVLRGKQLLVPALTIKRGVPIEVAPRAQSYASWCEEVRPLLAGRSSAA